MGGPDLPLSLRKRGDVDLVDAQVVDAVRHCRHVHDRVDGTHFVEVHGLDGLTMGLGLRLGDDVEDRVGDVLGTVGKRRAVNDSGDIGKVAMHVAMPVSMTVIVVMVMGVFMVVVVPVIVIMNVLMLMLVVVVVTVSISMVMFVLMLTGIVLNLIDHRGLGQRPYLILTWILQRILDLVLKRVLRRVLVLRGFWHRCRMVGRMVPTQITLPVTVMLALTVLTATEESKAAAESQRAVVLIAAMVMLPVTSHAENAVAIDASEGGVAPLGHVDDRRIVDDFMEPSHIVGILFRALSLALALIMIVVVVMLAGVFARVNGGGVVRVAVEPFHVMVVVRMFVVDHDVEVATVEGPRLLPGDLDLEAVDA